MKKHRHQSENLSGNAGSLITVPGLDLVRDKGETIGLGSDSIVLKVPNASGGSLVMQMYFVLHFLLEQAATNTLQRYKKETESVMHLAEGYQPEAISWRGVTYNPKINILPKGRIINFPGSVLAKHEGFIEAMTGGLDETVAKYMKKILIVESRRASIPTIISPHYVPGSNLLDLEAVDVMERISDQLHNVMGHPRKNLTSLMPKIRDSLTYGSDAVIVYTLPHSEETVRIDVGNLRDDPNNVSWLSEKVFRMVNGFLGRNTGVVRETSRDNIKTLLDSNTGQMDIEVTDICPRISVAYTGRSYQKMINDKLDKLLPKGTSKPKLF